jgi:parallel beta-helix repeat protein
VVEANTAIGNAYGIVVFAAATNSKVAGNVAVGNPPIQESNSIAGNTGVDIWDQSARGTTTFDKNICVTSINAPCASAGAIPRKPGG